MSNPEVVPLVYPRPFVPVSQLASLNPAVVHVVPRTASALVGTWNVRAAPGPTGVVAFCCRPYETSGACGGYEGEKACATVVPSGLTRARYSPSLASLKLVCSGAPATARFLPDANTVRNSPRARCTDGKRQSVRVAGSSVRYQPFRSTSAAQGL